MVNSYFDEVQKKDNIEEIISVEQLFMVLPNKIASKVVNNYKA